MELEDAIRTRRTHKAYGSEPVDPDDAGRAAGARPLGAEPPPDQPVALPRPGPGALARLKQAAGPEAAAKLDRAPTLVAVSVVQTGDPVADEEDLCAAACAAYIVLLAAHGRGLAGYWRTPAVLRSEAGRAALGIGADEHAIALLHLGPARQEQRAPERAPARDVVSFLD